MSEANRNQANDARQQAREIDRELQNLQQQIDSVDEEMTPDRLNEIIEYGEQVANELSQPQKD